MRPTTFIYSSHNCSPYIHKEIIAERALQSHPDKRLLYLPMSEYPVNGDSYESQRFGWDKVAWYFNKFKKWGLEPFPFYWNEHLSRGDLDILWEALNNAPVVILGGGNTRLGMRRYRALGQMYNGDSSMFARVLHARQERGLFTVGYSAGADQLPSVFGGAIYAEGAPCDGFGLARDIAVTLHHDWSRRDEIYHSARAIRHCSWFGLPNDSGLLISQGWLPSGLIAQHIQFVIDNSWDIPEDGFHIKTRQGLKIDHYYPDGRHWAFDGGDSMLRLMTPDGSARRYFLFVNGGCYDYDSQRRSGYHSMGEILHDFSHHSANR